MQMSIFSKQESNELQKSECIHARVKAAGACASRVCTDEHRPCLPAATATDCKLRSLPTGQHRTNIHTRTRIASEDTRCAAYLRKKRAPICCARLSRSCLIFMRLKSGKGRKRGGGRGRNSRIRCSTISVPFERSKRPANGWRRACAVTACSQPLYILFFFFLFFCCRLASDERAC